VETVTASGTVISGDSKTIFIGGTGGRVTVPSPPHHGGGGHGPGGGQTPKIAMAAMPARRSPNRIARTTKHDFMSPFINTLPRDYSDFVGDALIF
jgi:hypothetical protein